MLLCRCTYVESGFVPVELIKPPRPINGSRSLNFVTRPFNTGMYPRPPPQISTYACGDNRRDFALKIGMCMLLTSKNWTRHAHKVMTSRH